MTRLPALRVCAECGRYFQPVRSQMTCSPECAGQRRRRQQRESKRRAWAADPEGERAKQRARRAANLAEYRAGERRRKRKRRAPHPPKTCPRCGVEFVPRRRDQRLCSPGCRPPLSQDELRAIKVAAAQSDCSMTDLIRRALWATGLVETRHTEGDA